MVKGSEKAFQEKAHADVAEELNSMKLHEVKTFPLFGGPWGHVEVTRVATGWIYIMTSTKAASEPIFIPDDSVKYFKIKGKW